MIDRESVIDALEYLISDDCTDNQFDYADEIEAAIALLKEQEPMVMTLEDIETVGDSEPVYIETKISEKVNPAIFQPECSDGEYACVISSWSKSGFYSFESYYRDWRCWTARPTNEQRKATPWTE